MPEGNVETVRHSYERWLAGEVDTLLGQQHRTNLLRGLKMVPERFRTDGDRVLVDVVITQPGEPQKRVFHLWASPTAATPAFETFRDEADAVRALSGHERGDGNGPTAA